MLKATSQAALQSMESSLNILQDLRDLQINTVIAHHKHKSVSPLGMFIKTILFSKLFRKISLQK